MSVFVTSLKVMVFALVGFGMYQGYIGTATLRILPLALLIVAIITLIQKFEEVDISGKTKTI